MRQTSTLLAVRHAYEMIGDERCPSCPRRSASERGEGLYYEI